MDTASSSEIVLQYSRLQRASVYLLPATVVAVLLYVAWIVVTGTFLDTFGEPPHMVLVWGILLVSLPLNVWQSTNTLLSSVHLSESTLHRTRPLRGDTRIALDDIRRVLLGGASIEIYVSDDDTPDLTVERDLPDVDSFIDALTRRLPASTTLENPSGEFDDLLAARAEAPASPSGHE
jgi:hypothetical protein